MRSSFSKDKNDWNINRKFVDTFNELLGQVNLAIATGNLGMSYNYLWVLYNNMRGHQRVPVEFKSMILSRLKELSGKLRRIGRPDSADLQKQIDELSCRTDILEIHGSIMDMLYESKMINMHIDRDNRPDVAKTN